MRTLGPILVATDFSAHARHAAERAAWLAQETASPLTVKHVHAGEPLAQLRQWLGAGGAPEQQLRQDAQQRLRALADELHAARRAAVSTHDAVGPVVDEILQQADALDAALLVLGARGAGFLRRLIAGTTSERLMRRTARPLVVVRQTPHERDRRVLVAIDLSPWSARALATARRVAPHARLVLTTVFQVPFEDKLHFAGVEAATIEHYRCQARIEATQRLHALALAAGLEPATWQACIVEGDASLRIIEQEQEHDCDLVVLGKHGQSAAVDLLLGSVTKHVLAEGSADLLISTARDD